MSSAEATSTDTEILTRIVNPDAGDFPVSFAEELLKLEFTDSDRERMRELSELSRLGQLNEQEQAELDSFIRVGHFLSILKSKARASLDAS